MLLLSPVTSTTGYCFYFGTIPSFFLELFLHWSPVAYWAPTDLGSSSFIILSFCLFILFMGFSRQEYWSSLPFPSPVDHILSDLSIMTHPSWWPHMAWLSFIELHKSVVLVIRLASFLWLWFQCVCSLMPSCNIYHLTWVSLTLDVGYLFVASPAKCNHCSLPWTRGISSPPHPERGVAPLGPPAPTQPPLLGSGVAPLGHSCAVSLALSVAAPDLGRGVAPLGHASAWSITAGVLLQWLS